MKRHIPWGKLLLLLSLALILQGCLGIGDNSQKGNTITTNSNGNQVNIVQNLFKGKIYFTIDHNLWVTDGKNNTRKIMTGGNIYDPAVSPNGKWIVVSTRNKNSSDIAIMPVSGGTRHNLLSGSGSFYNDFQSLSIIHQRNHRMLLTLALGTGANAIQAIVRVTPLKSCTRTMHMILQHEPSKSSSYILKMPMPLQIILEYITLDSQATIPA